MSILGTVNGAELALAARQVAVAAWKSKDVEYDAPWTGTRIEVEPSILTLVATDRYRLGTRSVALSSTVGVQSAQLLVGARDLAEAAKRFAKAASVAVALADADLTTNPALILDDGAEEIVLPQLSAVFFTRWRELFPPTFDAAMTVDTKALQVAVREVARVAKTTTVRVTTHPTCHVTIGVHGLPNPEVHVPILTDDGPAIETHFDPKLLLSGVNALRGIETVVSFYPKGKVSDGGRPVSLACGGYTYLLMPRKVDRLAGESS